MGLEWLAMEQRLMHQLRGTPLQLRATSLRLLAGTGVLFLYLIFGAAMFSLLERKRENDHTIELREYKHHFVEKYKHCLPHQEIEDLIRRVTVAMDEGISPLKNVTTEPNWSFGQAFFFSGTLISTVGYGHVSPRTHPGKAFTIAYCLIGIPLCLALLTAVVERLRVPSLWFRSKIATAFGERCSPTHISFLHLFVTCAALVMLLFVIPSWIFTAIEPNWSFLDAFYYCFISLTTIGLGDYIPGDHPDQESRGVYKFLVTVYLLLGLAGMMLLLATVYDIPQLNLTRFFLMRDQTGTQETDGERGPLSNNTGTNQDYNRHVDEEPVPHEYGSLK